MVDDSDREKRKSRKSVGNKQKNKDFLNEDQKLANRAKKAFKNKLREIIEDETMDDIDYYGKYS